MGTKIVARGSVAPWNSDVIPPVTQGLEAWFTFDTALNRLPVNRAIGKPDGVINGNPTVFPGYARFKGGSSWVQTDVAETKDLTMIVVARSVNAIPAGTVVNDNNPFYMGNYNTPPADPAQYPNTLFGSSIYSGGPNSMTGTATRFTDAAHTAITSAGSGVNGRAETEWSIYSMSCSEVLGTVNRNHSSGVSFSVTNKEARVVGSRKMRIGSAYFLFAGECDVSFAAAYSRGLTAEELDKIVVSIRKRLTRLGISA